MVTQSVEKKTDEQIKTRPPVVVVLGHVDHGKSSLLEAIREDFRITSKESGGITQHIGAYMVEHEGKKITFLDTPGHELFSAMRSRGAKVADIAVLVVAADESVKPQTIEALQQIKKAEIPMVVAINKIDKPEANAERVKQELAHHEVMVESYGGNVPSVETSATTKQGTEELLEMLLLVADLEDLQTSFFGAGEGSVIESHLNPKRGPTTTVLVESGVVRTGDFIATASSYGKVRILEDFQGQSIAEASPSMPAVVLGFLQAPIIGEKFSIFQDEPSAQNFSKEHKDKKTIVKQSIQSKDQKTIKIIVKADVAGSLEALVEALQSIPYNEVGIRIVETGVGEVQETDIKLARSSDAIVLGFRTKISAAARDLAEKEQVRIETFEVIYEVIERARKLMEQFVEDEGGREEVGTLHVLGVFLVDKKRQVVGGKVTDGEVKKGLRGEIIRNDEIVGQGRITNVQHDKKDVVSVQKGKECGLSFDAEEKVQEGDLIQFFIEKPRKTV
jgi:translation initiation factor IF-2